MHPAPTNEQRELMQAVERFCRERIDVQRLAAWERERKGIDGRFWDEIAALGWFGLGLPEGAGGSGLGLTQVACLLHECSRGLIPRAVIGAIHGGWALSRLDPGSPELPDIASGQRTVAIALDEEECRDPSSYSTRFEGVGSAGRVTGTKWFVPNGEDADFQIVAACEGDEVVLLLVAREATSATPLRTFDGERQAIVRYDGSPIVRRLSQVGQGRTALECLRREATALALAEMIGGMEAVLDLTVAYVKEREQFGQKIAVFQAVQHQVADMGIAYTASRHLTWQAITRLQAGTEQGGELATAAAFVGSSFKRLTFAGHHLHGGAGYIVEHPLHYYAERAQALCIRHTREASALAEVASGLLD
jgi:alkylation response protein AidB-like acyl-CoA dehydrogenase